ncbi:sensor domain-containing diguanylate cyclase [Pseudaminobacter sp. 19-2017]|uniref:diguanylate cyclase n=1 Tax=Pseudaminobacter soli (ex Zhang et al. 2022) TaxID=2831468 RepID=A0A942I3B6_9HYPH|nr:sensor domain-containing diguanylate cyclase [Pseudaminobacter soli]MBS3650073.1 sensor domain-containing diguanylate cyclase [Pseudaminobacter soli]
MLREQTIGVEAEPSAAEAAEHQRLDALDRLDAVDAPRNESFDRIARLIQTIFEVPIALVTVIDAHRQLYKACIGLNIEQVERRDTICRMTIQQEGPMIISDTLADPNFATHPHVTGGLKVRFYAGASLRTPDGHNIGTVCAIDTKPRSFSERQTRVLAELADMTVEYIALRQLASIDALTGALTRRAFRESGERAIALAQRHKHNLSLIALDIDHFKRVNDSFGHAAGDQVLAAVASACAANLRQSDVFGRIGGEEFAIILPHTHRSGALEVAEKLRAAIAGTEFRLGGEPCQITASFGVSTLDIATTDVDGLLANADAALYQAKAEGRNRVIGWRPQPSPESHARRRVLKAGQIHFNRRMSTVDCTVRTLSEEGAGLDLSSSYGLPEKFNLMIRSDGIDRPCRIVSQTERHVEVEFC